MLRNVWTLRFFCLALAKHDIRERYRRSILGIAWSLIRPAGMTLMLTLVFSNVFAVPVREYAPYLFVGLIVWQFFSESILQGCNSFNLGATYLRVRPVPIAIFPLRVVLSAGLHALIGLSTATLAIAWLHGLEPMALLTLAPTLVILAITAWSLACICGILFTLFSDAQQMAEISLQALFYATPVIYLPQTWQGSGWLAWIIRCNPFSSLLELVRTPLLHGEMPDGSALAIALAFMVVSCGIAWCSLRRIERNLVLWL
ncbi:MAG TPA: ABC transporter permease [Gemmataceae bacterium]|nr:ABC transporter permease [Gemmataceae bacterium]